MNKPNLFSYATSELSQDAFICWLLAWAHPENKEINSDSPALHACARALIEAFFEKHKNREHPLNAADVDSSYPKTFPQPLPAWKWISSTKELTCSVL